MSIQSLSASTGRHGSALQSRWAGLRLDDPQQVATVVDRLLAAGKDAGASDVHLVPAPEGLQVHWRIDGVVEPIALLPRSIAPNVAARLKVLAELLTYRTDVPQEGRLRTGDGEVEMRVSTFPTLYGEKVVIRMFVGSGQYRLVSNLGLPDDVAVRLRDLLGERGGLLLVTGPAGSGKTTTVYAAMRELAQQPGGGRSLVSIEDPVEAVIPGVAQSQVQPAAGFTYETALRSLLRQDPDVMLVGEIRDPTTAELVFQASLTGHLVLSTFHAGDPAAAQRRLEDMGIEPYQLRSGLLAILAQRLMRRLCGCSRRSQSEADRLGLRLEEVAVAVGCERCGGTGYAGRLIVAELQVGDELRGAEGGCVEGPNSSRGGLRERARQAVEAGLTSPAELLRVFGLRNS